MIRLQKGDAPASLIENAAQWTADILDALERGERPTETQRRRYNCPDIKEAIVSETHGKCAYCESKIRHIAPGDIEHIVPKSARPELWFEWENLTLACPRCNTLKSDHGGGDDRLIDPYAEDPRAHLRFLGDLILPDPRSASGILTEAILKLNRVDLIERRRDRLFSVQKQLRLILEEQDADIREVLRADLINIETAADQEYSAAVRALVDYAREHWDL